MQGNACESVGREILNNSLTEELENTTDAKISNTPSKLGAKVVHNQKKKENTRKNSNFTRNKKERFHRKRQLQA